MKYLPVLVVVLLAATVPCRATHSLQYFVYMEDEYVQGPWDYAEQLQPYTLRFLRPVMFVETFGTELLDVPLSIMNHLAENRPDHYKWKWTLRIAGDTIVVETRDKIPDFHIVRNEVALSMIAQGLFNYVRFRSPGQAITVGKKDVDIPYFDLVFPGTPPQNTNQSVGQTSTEEGAAAEDYSQKEGEDTLYILSPNSSQPSIEPFVPSRPNKNEEPKLSLWIGFGGMLVTGALGFGLGKVIGRRRQA